MKSLRAWIGRVLGGSALEEQVRARVKEALADPFVDRDEHTFRMLGPRRTRGISDMTRRRQLEIVHHFFLSNPLAHRIPQLTTDFVLGEGVKFRAEAPEVQEILEAHWNDPINAWPTAQFVRVLELGLYGMQAWTIGVTPENGHVRLGYIDPAEIVNIETDPNDASRIVNLVLESRVGSPAPAGTGQAAAPNPNPNPQAPKRLRVVHVDPDPKSPTFGRRIGDVFYFRVNHVANEPWGNSDLLPLIDWLDLYDQFLFTVHEAAQLKTCAIWDVLVRGANEEKLVQMQRSFGRIVSGMTRFHNENVEIKNIAPDLQTSDLEGHARMLKLYIATGAGLPFHWLSEGGETNFATAAAMGTPVFKRLQARQREVEAILREVFDFVIDQAIVAGRLPADVDRRFSIDIPRLDFADTAAASSALATSVAAVEQAERIGILTQAEARRILAVVAKGVGVDLDPNLPEELQDAERLGPTPGAPMPAAGVDEELFRAARERTAALLLNQNARMRPRPAATSLTTTTNRDGATH